MRTALLLAALFAMSGCTRYYYAPNRHNVPLLNERHEVQLSGVYSTGAYADGAEVQAAYAATKGLGIIANACVLGLNIGEADAYLVEAGAGYYKPIPSQLPRINNKFVFELYGVAGMGRTKNFFTRTEYASARFSKLYVQPNIGFSHKIVDVALSAKFGYLHFYNIHRTSDTITPTYDYPLEEINSDLALLSNNRHNFLFEPAVTVRLGYKYVKFTYQMGWSFLSSYAQELNDNFNLNLGVVISLAPRFRKAKP